MGALQTKLKIGNVDAPEEREADRIADTVMRMPAPLSPVPGNASRNGSTHGSSCAPRRAHTVVSPRAGSGETRHVVGDALGSRGEPVDAATRAYFELRMGLDFGNVRVHRDTRAIASTRALNALAYTVGHDIVFNDGLYSPHTPAGRHLLAHELTHVIQQRGAHPVAAGMPHIRRTSNGHAPDLTLRRQPAGGPDKPQTGASGTEVFDPLYSFFVKVQAAQGGQSLKVTPVVRQALESLAAGDAGAALRIASYLAQSYFPGTPAELARDAMNHLPLVISRDRLARLDRLAPLEAPDSRPASIGDAAASIFRKTVTPIINALPVSKDIKSTLTEAALSAVSDGIVALVDAAMKNAPIDDKSRQAIHGAVDQLIKQKRVAAPAGNAPAGGQPAGAGSYAREPPPSVAPQMPSAPGESITKGPTVATPGMGAPKQNSPQAPVPATGHALEQTIQRVDPLSLVPEETRGKPEAADLIANAQDFARDVAKQLDSAQKAGRFTVDLPISAAYQGVTDKQRVFDAAEQIVRSVVDALPHHASRVGQVVIQIAASSTSMRRSIRIHEAH
ncbi:DUF4157 domain-containing protein [Paraburkholderia terrae]|uniref:eCIS core domain-containing protein n=1 Tax=Paraburkholderia terrae TaxID=311230 RepID=UPI001E3E4FC5|nr:DUF4157 domain-containing protein [Paraburkholderia terrae]